MSNHDESWPFTWSPPAREMDHLEIEWAQVDERRQATEAVETIEAAGVAVRGLSVPFAGVIDALQQLGVALGKICKNG